MMQQTLEDLTRIQDPSSGLGGVDMGTFIGLFEEVVSEEVVSQDPFQWTRGGVDVVGRS